MGIFSFLSKPDVESGLLIPFNKHAPWLTLYDWQRVITLRDRAIGTRYESIIGEIAALTMEIDFHYRHILCDEAKANKYHTVYTKAYYELFELLLPLPVAI